MVICKGRRKSIYLNDDNMHHKLPTKPGIEINNFIILYTFLCINLLFLLFRQGPSHKKFSEYFNNTSDSSDSDSNAEEDNPKSNKQHKSDSSESSDGDSLILPIKSMAKPNVQLHQIISESEPEDPEEVRIHQEKLKARRSRITTNMSTISVLGKQQDHLTLNMTNSKFVNHHFF